MIIYFRGKKAFQSAVIVKILKRPVGVVIADKKTRLVEPCYIFVDAVYIVIIGQRFKNVLFTVRILIIAVKMIAATETAVFDRPVAYVLLIRIDRKEVFIAQVVMCNILAVIGIGYY